MAGIKILAPAGSHGHVPVQGTIVMVGDEKLDRVMGMELVADINELWTLQIKVSVDPKTLFGELPPDGVRRL